MTNVGYHFENLNGVLEIEFYISVKLNKSVENKKISNYDPFWEHGIKKIEKWTHKVIVTQFNIFKSIKKHKFF